MKQGEILLRLVQGEDGQAWAEKMYGWSSNSLADVCDWTGIDCEGDESEGAVTSINLSQTLLLGTIPPELGDLTTLRKLDLSANLVMGSIPPELGRLPLLEEVILSRNQLNGPLPRFASRELRILDLEENKMSESLPDDFGLSHPKMINLNLVGNNFSGTLPESVTNMTNLVWLQLSENSFHGTLSRNLGNLYNLQFLYLDHNHFMGEIPRELTPTASRLTEVWFHNNFLSGTVPAAFAELKELKNLYVDGNKFVGSLPQDLCKPEINEDFFEDDISEADRNYCESIACAPGMHSPEGVWPCVSCSPDERNPYLGLEGECFSTKPWVILQKFYNAVQGEIDQQWAQISPTTEVCKLSGVTCSDGGQVTHLELRGRGLKGTIVSDLGFLEHLEVLDLSNNQLEGYLPSDLKFAPLTKLDITGNYIVGIVPPGLCQKRVNGNGANGVFDCNLVACPAGTYSNTGRADDRTCTPCDYGLPYLGKKSCAPDGLAATQKSSNGTGNNSTIVAAFFGIFGILLIIGGASFYYYRRPRKQDPHPSELAEFDLNDNFEPVTLGHGVLDPDGSNFPGAISIEPMDDDDYSSITRIRRNKKKKKKRKDRSKGDYDSVSDTGTDNGTEVGSIEFDYHDASPVWLDVPKLDKRESSSNTPIV